MGVVMHLVRTRIDRAALARLAARNGVLDDDLGYALHQALIERLGPAEAPKPFRRLEPDAATRRRLDPPAGVDRDGWDWLLAYAPDPSVLSGYKTAPPDPTGDWDRHTVVETVLPEPFEVRSMPVECVGEARRWSGADSLGFEVLVRPVRRLGPRARAARKADDRNDGRKDGLGRPLRTGVEGQRGSVELDAFELARERFSRGDPDAPSRASAYADWLAERLAPAAELERPERDDALLHRFRRTRVVRAAAPRTAGEEAGAGRGRGGRGMEQPEALMCGVLRVVDPQAFAALLARGVGRHRAFGFGMVLLRPVGSERR